MDNRASSRLGSVTTPAMISSNAFPDTIDSSAPICGDTNLSATANLSEVDDSVLVLQFNSGNEDAFSEIVNRYRSRMLALALRHLRNYADAEEIAQDTFIRAYRGLARFRGDSSLSSWLHRIAFNLSRNRYGYYSRRHRAETSSFDCVFSEDNNSTFADMIASDMPDPAREETNREFLAHVKTCMNKLSLRQREILILRNSLDNSYEEIAATLSLGAGTVKSRIARARKDLRGFLEHAYGEFEPTSLDASPWFESNRPIGRLQMGIAGGKTPTYRAA